MLCPHGKMEGQLKCLAFSVDLVGSHDPLKCHPLLTVKSASWHPRQFVLWQGLQWFNAQRTYLVITPSVAASRPCVAHFPHIADPSPLPSLARDGHVPG